MTSDPNATALAHVAGTLGRMLYVFVAAALASIAAGVIGVHAVFGPEWLSDFDDNGLPLLIIMFGYAFPAAILWLPAIHALLRRSQASRLRDLASYVSLAAMSGVLWLLASSRAPDTLAAVNLMAAYYAVSSAVAGLIFWLLVGRWRNAGQALEAVDG
jgi:hypothetical protein